MHRSGHLTEVQYTRNMYGPERNHDYSRETLSRVICIYIGSFGVFFLPFSCNVVSAPASEFSYLCRHFVLLARPHTAKHVG